MIAKDKLVEVLRPYKDFSFGDKDAQCSVQDIINVLEIDSPRVLKHEEIVNGTIDGIYIWIEVVEYCTFGQRVIKDYEVAPALKFSNTYFAILGKYADEEGYFNFDGCCGYELMGDTWYQSRCGVDDFIKWRFWTNRPSENKRIATMWD